jgi:thermitase
VAIVDTGVDASHEDLQGVFRRSPGNTDKHGHGSHCAGLAGAIANNNRGMASANLGGDFVEIMGFSALNQNGSGTAESVAQAIIDAAQAGADVISLSLGGRRPIPDRVEVAAVTYALRKGCIVVAAAGNSNEDAAGHSPANIAGVICVAAVNERGEKANFSNTNNRLARPIAAPGVDMLSLKAGGGYVAFSGTSMATPMVSGLLGVLRALKPDLSAAEAYRILNATGESGPDANRVGKTLQPAKAVKRVLQQRIG